MARPSQPWFRESKGTWYCTLNGKKVSLKVRGRENEKEAIQAWHRLFANGTPEPVPESRMEVKSEPRAEGIRVSEVINGFLADCDGRVGLTTLRVRSYFLLPFAGTYGSEPAEALTPMLVEAYSRKPNWNDGTRHDFLKTLVTAFHWAERARLIGRSPLLGLRKPPKASRGAEALVRPEDHARLYEAAPYYFKPFLTLLFLTGARPGEIAAITADNFDADTGLIYLRKHKTAHKGKSRTIFLSPEAVTLLLEQKAKYGEGHLFRNSHGKPWTGNALVKAMISTRRKAGLDRAICYGYRHGFATTALVNGVPDAQVAALLGHSGTAMLHKHYSHLTAQTQALREALGRVRA